jgi:hypothetical protein
MLQDFTMRKTDGRKISPKAMEEIRVRAVQRVQAGESPEVVIKTLQKAGPQAVACGASPGRCDS